MSEPMTTHDCRNGHHGRLCGMRPCHCECHDTPAPSLPADHTTTSEENRP